MRAVAAVVLAPLAALALVHVATKGLADPVRGEQHPTEALVWGDRVFTSKRSFAAWLDRRGETYGAWAKKHPNAAPWSAKTQRPPVAQQAGDGAAGASQGDDGGAGTAAVAFALLVGLIAGATLAIRRSRGGAVGAARGAVSRLTTRASPGSVVSGATPDRDPRMRGVRRLPEGLRSDRPASAGSALRQLRGSIASWTMGRRDGDVSPPLRLAPPPEPPIVALVSPRPPQRLDAAPPASLFAPEAFDDAPPVASRRPSEPWESQIGVTEEAAHETVARVADPRPTNAALPAKRDAVTAAAEAPPLATMATPAPAPARPETPAVARSVLRVEAPAPNEADEEQPAAPETLTREEPVEARIGRLRDGMLCEILFWRGYVKGQFYARVDELGLTAAESPMFRCRSEHPEQTADAEAAQRALVDGLLADGWQLVGRGHSWWSATLMKPRSA